MRIPSASAECKSIIAIKPLRVKENRATKSPRKSHPATAFNGGFTKCVLICQKVFLKEYSLYEYCDADKNKYGASKNTSLALKLCSRLSADENSRHTNDKRHDRDKNNGNESLNEIVFGKVDARGERVNGGRDALNDKRSEGKSRHLANTLFLAKLIFLYAVDYHLYADKGEKNESDPRNKIFKPAKEFYYGVQTYPSDEGHKSLKYCENRRDAAHFTHLHFGLVKSVCQGYREGVHCKAYAESYIYYKK